MKYLIFLFLFVNTTLLSARDLDEIIKSGHINIGARLNTPMIYSTNNPQGKPDGFVYELVRNFADDIGVKVNLITVTNFSDYFTSNGIKPNGVESNDKIIYTPTLFQNIDIAAEIITVLPWREKLLKLHPYIVNIEMIFTKKGKVINSIEDLKGKKVVVNPLMSFCPLLKDIDAKLGTNQINIIYDNNYSSGTRSVESVLNGESDFEVQDSASLFIHLKKLPKGTLTTSIPIGKTISYLACATSKDTIKLNKRFEEYLNKIKKDGTYNNIFKKYYDISFNDYLKIIQWME